jgi:hypothetical protein
MTNLSGSLHQIKQLVGNLYGLRTWVECERSRHFHLNERLLPPDTRTRNRPGGSAATGTTGDVAERALFSALLLDGVYDAGGLVEPYRSTSVDGCGTSFNPQYLINFTTPKAQIEPTTNPMVKQMTNKRLRIGVEGVCPVGTAENSIPSEELNPSDEFLENTLLLPRLSENGRSLGKGLGGSNIEISVG